MTFTPASAGSVSGSVTITSNASNPSLTIPLSGMGVAPGVLGSNPTNLALGNVTVGSNKSLSETVTNTGGSSVTISQVGISGTGFSLSGITTPVTLTAGQSASFSVTFTPQTAASASGSVTVTSNASNPTLTIPLSGTGIAPGTLGSNPTSLSFGSVTVGSNKSLSETITNTGGASVTISQIGISGTGFTLSGVTAPVTLTAGQSASFTVTFAPQTAASASGNVTVTSNASNPTLTIPLSGTGVAPGTLGSNPTSLSFGSVTVGSNQALSETAHQYRWFQRDDFSGRNQRNRIQPDRDHCSDNADRRTEHKLHRHVRSAICRKRERQRHDHLERVQSYADDTAVRNGRRGSWAADRYSNHTGARQRCGGNQRNSIWKPDSQRRECYGHGCEFEQFRIQRRRPGASGDYPGWPERIVYRDLQPAGIRLGERYAHLHQQCSACYHDRSTDWDWNARAGTHGGPIVDCEHLNQHFGI